MIMSEIEIIYLYKIESVTSICDLDAFILILIITCMDFSWSNLIVWIPPIIVACGAVAGIVDGIRPHLVNTRLWKRITASKKYQFLHKRFILMSNLTVDAKEHISAWYMKIKPIAKWAGIPLFVGFVSCCYAMSPQIQSLQISHWKEWGIAIISLLLALLCFGVFLFKNLQHVKLSFLWTLVLQVVRLVFDSLTGVLLAINVEKQYDSFHSQLKQLNDNLETMELSKDAQNIIEFFFGMKSIDIKAFTAIYSFLLLLDIFIILYACATFVWNIDEDMEWFNRTRVYVVLGIVFDAVVLMSSLDSSNNFTFLISALAGFITITCIKQIYDERMRP